MQARHLLAQHYPRTDSTGCTCSWDRRIRALSRACAAGAGTCLHSSLSAHTARAAALFAALIVVARQDPDAALSLCGGVVCREPSWQPETEGAMDWAELMGYLTALSRCPQEQLLQYDAIRGALERWRDEVRPSVNHQGDDTTQPEGHHKLVDGSGTPAVRHHPGCSGMVAGLTWDSQNLCPQAEG